MHALWAVVTIGAVVAIVGVAAWVFLVAPFVVPNRAGGRGAPRLRSRR